MQGRDVLKGMSVFVVGAIGGTSQASVNLWMNEESSASALC